MVRIAKAHLFHFVLIVAISVLTTVYLAYSERVVPPWDPSAMAILGKSIVQRQSIQYYNEYNETVGPYFNPHGISTRSPFDPQPYSTFPPGFPLILAIVYQLTGSIDYFYLVPSIFMASGLIAAAYLGYVLSGQWGSFFAVLLIGTSQVVITFATSVWSDGPSLGLLLSAMALYVAASRSGRWWIALLSGACLGLFTLFKFVNIVFTLLIVAHQFLIGQGRRRWIVIGCLSVGVALGVVGMLLYQARAFGGPLANAYQPWGRNAFPFPLFSLQYLFIVSPRPWNDFSSNAVVQVMLNDMGIWTVFFVVAFVIDRRNPWRLLLALIVAANMWLYALSVFTPRQFPNMRYMLPALTAAYLLAATALARWVSDLGRIGFRVAVVALTIALCVARLSGTFPVLAQRYEGTATAMHAVVETARALPEGSVVLAYNTADHFILYGNLSVLNYRHIKANDVSSRNQLVLQAIDKLLCMNTPVYLVKDDEGLFQSVYSDLQRHYDLRPVDSILLSYQIVSGPASVSCSASN